MIPERFKLAVFIMLTTLLSVSSGVFPGVVRGDIIDGNSRADRWVRQALAGDAATAQQAMAALRRLGAPAVEHMLAARPTADGEAEGSWRRALDTVCGQLDCVESRLFWFQDLDLAVQEAQRSQRPILSLRLLGRLDEELSCANSRFFRSILYADPMISDFLRQRFVLHWSSERPVPTFHLDFGEGRRLEGTLTGNSIHYVLDRRGRPVDGLPGLYGPGFFRGRLWAAAALADRLSPLDDDNFIEERAEAHGQMLARLAAEVSPVRLELDVLRLAQEGGDAVAPSEGMTPELTVLTARLAGERALSKAIVESPLVEAMSLGSANVDPNRPLWEILAEHHWRNLRLSETSLGLLRRQLDSFDGAVTEEALTTIQLAIGIDAMRNEYELHAVLHTWLTDTRQPQLDMGPFNARVYAELFLTPAEDPWLGLASVETFLALSGVAVADPGE